GKPFWQGYVCQDPRSLIAAENATIDKWTGWDPDYVFRAKRLYDYTQYAIDPAQLLQPERASIDKWRGYQPEFIYRAARLPDYTHSSIDVRQLTLSEFITLDKWYRFGETPRIARQVPQQAFTADTRLFSAPGVENITLDKWRGYQNDYVQRS